MAGENEGPSPEEMGVTREEVREKLNSSIARLKEIQEILGGDILMPDDPKNPEFSGKKVSEVVESLKKALEEQEKRMN